MTLPLGSWSQDATPDVPDAPPDDDPTDVLVVGAGLNGLHVARGALEGGLTVRVVEAHPRLGRLASGLNTGKVSALQGTQLSSIARDLDRDAAVAYGREQVEAVSALRAACDDLGVAYDLRDAGTYVPDRDDLDVLVRERDLAVEAGMGAEVLTAVPGAPYAAAAVTVPEQLQLDPHELLTSLARDVVTRGGRLHLGHRVRRILPSRHGSVVRTVDGTALRARHVVVATGTPILARGGYFARLEPERSYIVAFEGPRLRTPMLLAATGESRSVRDVQGRPFSLVVGGAGHGVGRRRSEYAGVRELCAWAARHFPDHTPVAHWSAQDYMTLDHRPVVEGWRSGAGTLTAVTGMNKWGLTNSLLAARRVLAGITGEGPVPGSARGLARQLSPRSAARLVGINAEVGLSEVRGTCRAAADLVVPGGDRRRRTGICTHLGGTLTWNDAQDSLDCPLHGSRFEPDGSVIEGYATRTAPTVGR